MMKKEVIAVLSGKLGQKAGVALALVVIVVIAVITDVQLHEGSTHQSMSYSASSAAPFDYNLTVYPANDSLQQDGKVQTTQIQVSGTITDDSNSQAWPTKIQFIPQTDASTPSSVTATVHLDLTHFSGIVNYGTYNTSLPNQQKYSVIISWNAWPPNEAGPLPNLSDLQSGTVVYGCLTVNCNASVTSMTQDFTI